MATKHTLTGNVYDLAGIPLGATGVRVAVVTNLPKGEALIDKTTNSIHLGGKPATLDQAGAFTVDLIATDATDLNVAANTLQYEVQVEYVDPANRGRTTWASGWFAMTADANLADLATDASPIAVATASSYALEAKGYRDEAAAITGLTGEDAAVALLVNDSGSDTAGALSATIGARVPEFHAEAYKTGSRTDKEAIQAACAAATAFAYGAKVVLSSRTWEVGTGLSMSGYSCGLVGTGSSYQGEVPTGTVIKASTQAGAVLDLTGFQQANYFLGRMEFGNFILQGSGVGDPTRANIGLRRATVALASVWVHDITITRTGGPCVDLYALYLSDVDRITLHTPIDATANNVPYIILRGCNGNRFNGLGFRSTATTADTGAGGALVLTDDGSTYPSNGNEFIAPWFENLHAPTNGALIHCEGNGNRFEGAYFVDCGKEVGATGTAYARFAPANYSNFGGNSWAGRVPGKGTGPQSPDVGIALTQSGNRIEGAKGYQGTNVSLAAGVGQTYAHLGGRESSATVAAFVANSGVSPNVLIDDTLLTGRFGSWSRDDRTSANGAAGPRIFDPTTPANGGIWLGQSGARWQAAGGVMTGTGDGWVFRDTALATLISITKLGGAKGIQFQSSTLPTASASYRGTVAWAAGGGGVADRLVVCRKDAADAYAWVDLF